MRKCQNSKETRRVQYRICLARDELYRCMEVMQESSTHHFEAAYVSYDLHYLLAALAQPKE